MKGLPKKIEEQELRNLFSSAGQVTDAKIIRDKNGNSRQFAFIGFRNDKEATQALKKMNGTYIRTSRVQVQVARPAGDPSIPRPWSKHSKGSSAYEKRVEQEQREEVEKFRAETRAKAKLVAAAKKAEAAKKKVGDSTIADKDKVQFDAFRDAARKRSSTPVWADGQTIEKTSGKKKNSKDVNPPAEMPADSSDDEYAEIPKKKEEDLVENEEEETNPIAHDDAVSDGDYFKSKISKAAIDCGDSDENEANEKESAESGIEKENGNQNEDEVSDEESGDEESEIEDESAEPKPESEESVGKSKIATESKEGTRKEPVDAAETGRLFIRNLPYNITEEDLEGKFEKYGVLDEVHLVVDSFSKRPRGTAYISFTIPENAAKAMAELDGTVFCGRLIHILPGRAKVASTWNSAQTVGVNKFKMEREKARAEAARSGRDASSQNMMHLDSDAVADSMAKRLGVSKAELLGTSQGESGNAAVRMSIAEATMQAEVRVFLKDSGIDMAKVEQASAAMKAKTTAGKRSRLSRTTFLVKNLPSGTSEKQLDALFQKFGTLSRLSVAPNSLLAIVEYSTPGEAKRAYAQCAYKRFRDVPLYLEWLPAEAVVSTNPRSSMKNEEGPSTETQPGEIRGKQEERLVNACSVYVKNLNFDTKEEALQSHMKQVLRKRQDVMQALRSVAIATKVNPKDQTGERLSQGFGFVEFSSYSFAAEAVKLAQGSTLEGHKLDFRVSNRQADTTPGSRKRKRVGENKKPSAKLLVRNVAFQASMKEVRQLFASFGQLKRVRLPRKMDGSHRGFGFMEFVSTNEAKAAKEALADAHLYGRHLVIEYADEEAVGETSIEKLVQSAAQAAAKSKRRRFSVDENANEADGEQGEELRDALYN